MRSTGAVKWFCFASSANTCKRDQVTMILPDRLTAHWIAELGDSQLVEVESHFYGEFFSVERDDHRRCGTRYYKLLQRSGALLTAWRRWSMVNTEVRARGLVIRDRTSSPAPNSARVSDDGDPLG